MSDPKYPPADIPRNHLRRIEAGSLLKLVLMARAAISGPLSIVFGVMAAGGAGTVKFNEAPPTGAAGFFGAIPMAPLFIGLFSLMAWVAADIGIRLAEWIKPLNLDCMTLEDLS